MLMRRGWIWGVLLLACGVAVWGVGGWSADSAGSRQSRSMRVASAHSGLQRRDRFLSLVPACGCARRTELDAYSTVTGRWTRRLGSVPLPAVADVDAPAVQNDGDLLITVSTGWRCAARGHYMECPKIAPNSCTNRVLSDTPGAGRLRVAFTVPGRSAIEDAIPSANGGSIAFYRAPCTSENGLTGVFLRSTRTARERLLFGRRNACDAIDRPAWNTSGDRLVFVYDHARSAPTRGPVGGVRGCGQTRNEIVVTGTGPHHRIDRIADEEGCAYAAATFDPRGVLAVEGCKRGSRPDPVSTGDGDAYLVQLSASGQRLERWALKRGLEQALITHEPGTRRLLITQDLPANNNEPEADWVWELDGAHLRLVGRYPANDAAQVLAVGW